MLVTSTFQTSDVQMRCNLGELLCTPKTVLGTKTLTSPPRIIKSIGRL